jgi:Fic family protein
MTPGWLAISREEQAMKPYLPEALPIADLDLARLFPRIGPANAALARYDGLLQSVINPAVMLSPLTNREAVLSSKIEGTQATVDEVLEFEAGFDFEGEKVKDIQEILNYRKVLGLAAGHVADRPINLGLVRQMHSVLLDSVRGATRSPGEFRREQNWIGPYGCAIGQATFVPPSPFCLLDHLQAWERYLSGQDVDLLVQAAIMHAQFELIHPFSDGNGRVGRLLIPLFLYHKRVLATPMFYLSEYLEAHREDYYACLQGLSRARDWTAWVAFFLDAVQRQAVANTDKVRAIMDLYERMKQRIIDLTHSQYAIAVLDSLFDRPVFRSSDFVQRSGIPKQTALPFLRKLREAGVLRTVREQSGRRPAILAFVGLLNCAEGREVF